MLAGVTGGPVRGVTNHFIPVKPFSTGNKNTELFPGVWKKKVPKPEALNTRLVEEEGAYYAHITFYSKITKAVYSRQKQELVLRS